MSELSKRTLLLNLQLNILNLKVETVMLSIWWLIKAIEKKPLVHWTKGVKKSIISSRQRKQKHDDVDDQFHYQLMW